MVEKSKTLQFSKSFTYGVEMMKSVVLYYICLALLFASGIGFMNSSLGESEEGGFVVWSDLLGMIIIFISILGITALHIGIYYKIWIDIRNNSG